jgi:hypothetical protein
MDSLADGSFHFLPLDPGLVGPSLAAAACVVRNGRLGDVSHTDELVSTAVVVRADVVVSETQVVAAVTAAALATERGVCAARSFHAEVLYRMSSAKRVGDALKQLGVHNVVSKEASSSLPPVVVIG